MVLPSIAGQQVLDQMNRIIGSSTFRPSQILCDFLKFIVTETIEGRSSQLKEYTVGVNALLKKSFNPQSDASVRIHAGRLRKMLDLYYSTEGVKDEVCISLPKGTYVPLFELMSKVGTARLAKTFPHSPTIAVMPFSVTNPGLDGPIADAICHQLSTDLTSFNEISVISYYSSKRLSTQENDLRKLGEILDASYMITGNVVSSGTRVRINVQLLVVQHLQQIWATTYEKDRDAFDSMAVQDDIVKHVINQIAGTHGMVIRHMVRIPGSTSLLDLKVYDAVFWYYYLVNGLNEPVNGLNEEVFRKVLHSIRTSVEADTRYALGWGILCEAYVAGYFFRFDCGVEDPLKEAVRCGQMALQQDAKCHHAYQALALAWLFLRKREECLRVADQWISLRSGMAGIAGGIGFCLICCGEFEKGYKMLNDSIQLNPFYQWWFNGGLSIYYFEKGQWDEAYYWAQKMLSGHMPWALILMIAALRGKGQEQEAGALTAELYSYIPRSELRNVVYSFILDNNVCDRIYAAVK